MLDTAVVSALMRKDAVTAYRLSSAAMTDCLYVSAITHGEIRFGITRLPVGPLKEQLEKAYEMFLHGVRDIVPVTRAVAERYSLIKHSTMGRGRTLGENDLWIAATAIEHGFTMVTVDRDFDAVDGLLVEDWTE